jgi:hypothetical protein
VRYASQMIAELGAGGGPAPYVIGVQFEEVGDDDLLALKLAKAPL